MNYMQLSPVALSLLIAAALGWAALEHGAAGFMLMAVFLAIGLVVGRLADGRIDARKFWDLVTGRRSSS